MKSNLYLPEVGMDVRMRVVEGHLGDQVQAPELALFRFSHLRLGDLQNILFISCLNFYRSSRVIDNEHRILQIIFVVAKSYID